MSAYTSESPETLTDTVQRACVVYEESFMSYSCNMPEDPCPMHRFDFTRAQCAHGPTTGDRGRRAHERSRMWCDSRDDRVV